MNKKNSIILWIVAVVLLITAASIVYSKYKPKGGTALVPQESTVESTVLSGEKTTEPASTSEGEKKTFAPDFTLKDMNGNNVKLSDYKGKIVILNFWAVWCKYCVQEMPDLNELNKELEKDKDVVILAVDAQEDKTTVKNFLDSNNITLKVLLDSDGAITQTYGITGFPTTFVVNRDGSIYTSIIGATNKAALLDIISKIK